LKKQMGMHLHQATNSCGKTLSSSAGVVRRGHGLLGEKIAIDVGKAYPGLLCGRRSATRIALRSFSLRKVGLRPRGSRPIGPWTTQRSRISCSVISETVLL